MRRSSEASQHRLPLRLRKRYSIPRWLAHVVVCLICLAAGCTLPPMSIYIGSKTLHLTPGDRAYVEAGGYHYLRAIYSDQSLDARLKDSGVDHVEIELTDGGSMDVASATVEGADLCVSTHDEIGRIRIDRIRRIVILGPVPAKRIKEEVETWAVFYGALAAAPGLFSEDHKLNPVAVAAGVGVGAGLGVLYGQMRRSREEVLFRDYTVMQNGDAVPLTPE